VSFEILIDSITGYRPFLCGFAEQMIFGTLLSISSPPFKSMYATTPEYQNQWPATRSRQGEAWWKRGKLNVE